MSNSIKYLSYFLVFFLGLAFCIRQLGEPDVFWQIETGRFIIENGYVPDYDVFSFTYEGDLWTNVKWGTEVIMASITDLMGPEALMLLQMLILALVSFLLYKTTLLFLEWQNLEVKELDKILPITYLIFFLFMSYRLNGRPEMMSHFYTALYLYLFIDYFKNHSKKILLLIPLQLLWANMHEAYGVGMVMVIIVISGIILEQNLFSKKGNIAENKYFMIAGLISLITPAIHPMGPKMILYPFNIYGQLGENQFTTENFGFRASEYWQLPSFIFLAVFILALFTLRSHLKSKKTVLWKGLIQQYSLPYLLLFMAFFVLGLQAFRNMPYFVFTAFPPLVLLISGIMKKRKQAMAIAIAFAFILILSVGSGKFYDAFFPREKYGLRINPERSPIGVAKFISENNIQGKGYVDYLSSSYLLWYLDDNYKTYVDLRDLDVFESKFMENVLLSYQYPNAPVQGAKDLFTLMDQVDTFNYAVLVNKSQLKPIISYLNKSKSFQLCYADPVSSLYLRNTSEHSDLISRFKDKDHSDIFHGYQEYKSPVWAKALSKFFWPFYKEIDYSKQSVSREAAIHKNYLK